MFQAIKFIFYASLRLFLIQIFHVMTTICNYQDLTWYGLTIRLPQRRGVCIYYRNFLPLKLIDIYFLNECITFETCNFVSLYRSPNRSKNDFENFCNNFELTLEAVSATNPFLIFTIGDFNTKSNNWYTGDTTTSEGSKIEAILSQFGLQQIVNKPAHIQR